MTTPICQECKFSGIRLYKPLGDNKIFCLICLLKLGANLNGAPGLYYENLYYEYQYYHPMDTNGEICNYKQYKKWVLQPIRISDLYEAGSAKYKDAESKISNLQIQN